MERLGLKGVAAKLWEKDTTFISFPVNALFSNNKKSNYVKLHLFVLCNCYTIIFVHLKL